MKSRVHALLAICLSLAIASSANASDFSLRGRRTKILRAGERFRVCLMSAELRDMKLLEGLVIPKEVTNIYPDAGKAGLPWDIKLGQFSEDTDAKALAIIGAKYAAKAVTTTATGPGVVGAIASQAIAQIPSGPDNEVEPDVYAELSLDDVLLLRTEKVNGTLKPTWNHCGVFKRKNLVGRKLQIRVVDYDVVRLDPSALLNKTMRARGDVAGIVEGPEISTAFLTEVARGKALQQSLRVDGDNNLVSVTWAIEKVQ